MALGQASPRRGGLRQIAGRGFFGLLLLSCVGSTLAADATPPPGLGEWEVSFFTTKAEGIGCGFDWLDVQVDDEIITGLVISQVEGSDCSPGSTGCQYMLNWKCAVYDTFDDSPEKQTVPATISADGKQATLAVPPYTSQLFTGKQTMKFQTIIATNDKVEGSEAWTWTSTDDQAYVCEGEDRISAIKQVFPCEPDWYDEDYGYLGEEFPEGPVPEGQWQIEQETKTAEGSLCDELGLEVGMKTSSSIIISQGYADDGSLSDTKYDVYFKCSSDDALIDQIDEAELEFKDDGKMVLTIKRKETMDYTEDGYEDFYEYDDQALTEEESAELQAIANQYGGGNGEAFSEGEEMDYTLVFCPDEKAPRKYKICEGTGNWHWWIQGDSCKGTEKFTGQEGNCTDQMMGVDDWYSEWDEDDWYGGSEDYEDWWQDDYSDDYAYEGEYGGEGGEYEEDQSWWDYLWGGDYDDQEGEGGENPVIPGGAAGKDGAAPNKIGREEEGRVDLSDPSMANKPFWEHADLDPAHGPIAAPKRDEDGNSAPRPKKPPVISAWGSEELSKDGYPVRHYRSPGRSRMGALFVGVPLMSLFLGIGYIAYKRYRARGGSVAYSRVAAGR